MASSKQPRTQDKWSVSHENLRTEEHVKWKDLTSTEKTVHVLEVALKVVGILFVLYVFICSLNLLAEAFKLIGGRGIGGVINNSSLIQNPISAAIIGMVVTLILQSSSTLMSVMVGMIAGNLITVHNAIPVMMGSEMGSSIMNALISLTQSGDRHHFRRAFAAATMNDVYNVCCVFTILPLEVAFGIIEKLSGELTKPLQGSHTTEIKTLQYLTDPIVERILKVDDETISQSSLGYQEMSQKSLVYRCLDQIGRPVAFCPYNHIFAYSTWSDTTIAIVVLAGTIACLIFCLLMTVKLMMSLLGGRVAVAVRKLLDKDCPGVLSCFTGYIVMGFGCVVVMLIQSSSVFRSALNPLVAIGVVTLDRMYPLIIGGNIGTTFTGILAALSADSRKLQLSLQFALCQTIFNLIGMLFFYPIPFTRNIPIYLAKQFGNITANHRWFAIVYIVSVFLVIPAVLLGLSFAPSWVMFTVLGCFLGLLVAVGFVNLLQKKAPKYLPAVLRDWTFLPPWLRSLDPYDEYMERLGACMPCCRTCCQGRPQESDDDKSTVVSATTFYQKAIRDDAFERWMRLSKNTQV
ncbi:hypothetical protein QR680_019149 [Steinernema hermaphroditum]|uniref:Sodium-dependent phosphate transporter n=1 Tax=Steinernema hermaphroditum TaxID=289476 RepID=A0AA39HLF6_9BILA|nr:hypothetical protein QR680_019149 [Steinernema hermaphroditum]